MITPFEFGCCNPPGVSGDEEKGVTGDGVPLPFLERCTDPGRLIIGRTPGRPLPMGVRMVGLALVEVEESERSSTRRSPRSVKKGLASLYEPIPGYRHRQTYSKWKIMRGLSV